MLFTKPSKLAALACIILFMQGCQTTDETSKSGNNEPLEPVRELTPMEKIHQSPNLYLVNKPVVSPDIVQAFEAANSSIKRESWNIANKQLLDLTIAAPTLSGPWLLLGDIAMAQDETSHAMAHYQQAIYVNKHNYFARNRLAALLRESGKFEEAKSQYMQSLESWPAYVNANRNLGILLDLYIGDMDEALKHYQIAFALDALNNTPEDRQLKGWIADLSRRVAAIKKAEARKLEAEKLKQQAALSLDKKNNPTDSQVTPKSIK